jgi:hypothetical protein
MRTEENAMPLSTTRAPLWLLPTFGPNLCVSGVEKERTTNAAPAASELKGL